MRTESSYNTSRLLLSLSLGILTALLISASAVAQTSPVEKERVGPPEAPAGSRWEPIPELTDEFNGDSLDSAKWIPKHPSWKGREPSHFDPANVSVHDGNLLLRSTTTINDLSTVKNPEKDVWVQSACVSSKGATAFYGYYESRMKASRLCMTSSFWFQGKYSEIDVVEQLGVSLKIPANPQLMLMNTHFFRDGWPKDKATPKHWQMPTGAADDYHVYGVWWKDKETVWLYHNGQKVAELKPGGEFNEPMTLFFDTEVFKWDGFPTLESLKDPAKNAMAVDWVRSWKLVPTTAKQ